MGALEIIALVLGFALALALLALGLRAWLRALEYDRIETSLEVAPDRAAVFNEALLADLPPPARRFLLHAIPPGTTLARSARLWLRGTLKPSPEAPAVALTAEELLTPGVGFLWSARARMRGLPIRVLDHYAAGDGGVLVTILGLLPVQHTVGPDVARSSAGRLAGESIWVPSRLMPAEDVRWEPLDEDHARVIQTVDGEEIAMTLAVDASGRVYEITMDRHGDVAGSGWGPVPYGFQVLAERELGGYTVASELRGGWWYGTERYDPQAAASFTVVDARYR